LVQVPRKPQYRALAGIDRKALEAFQAGIRKRYTDEQILEELTACAQRLGRSPTMREFAEDPETSVHPQTVIEHFGSWNEAKRKAGLVPRRFATREELLALLKELGDELGRIPTARDIEAHRGRMPSKSLYWHTFGSLANALREAGFDVPVGEEKLERALEQGEAPRRELDDRVADLPHVRGRTAARRRRAAGEGRARRRSRHALQSASQATPRRVVDVPVPDPRAALGIRREGRRRRTTRLVLSR
jgi:hypothetical protein